MLNRRPNANFRPSVNEENQLYCLICRFVKNFGCYGNFKLSLTYNWQTKKLFLAMSLHTIKMIFFAKNFDVTTNHLICLFSKNLKY